MKENLTSLFGLFVTQLRTGIIHHQHLVKVLVDQIAVIECPMKAVHHLHYQMMRVLAGVLILSIGFVMIAQLGGLLSQSLPNLQQLNVQQAFMFLEKQPLLLLTWSC